MTKKTKKRIGVAAMALVMAGAIGATAGTTLARYISSTTVESQSATVARWGFTMSANTDKMFGEEYGYELDGTANAPTTHAKVSGNGVVVKAEGNYNVVAPGTTGYMTYTVNGTAEVNAVLTFDFSSAFKTVHLYDGAEGNVDYYPINWFVGATKVNAVNKAPEAADFANALGTVFAGNTAVTTSYNAQTGKAYVFIPAGESISNLEVKISWAWDFQTAKGEGNYDIEDTLLGYLSYGAKFDELSDNVKEWLAGSELTGKLATAKGAVTTAEENLITAQKALTDAQIAYDKADVASKAATKAQGDAQAVLNALTKPQGWPENEATAGEGWLDEQAESEYKTAYIALQNAKEAAGLASTALSNANTALTNANTALANAKNALGNANDTASNASNASAYAKFNYAQAQFNSAVEEAYDALKGEGKSSWNISFGFSAEIAQVQYATAAEFLKAYPVSPKA